MLSFGTKLKYILKEMRLHIALLIFLIILGGIDYAYLRVNMLKNMQQLGTSIARNYAMEKENELTVYKTLLNYAVTIVDTHYTDSPVENVRTAADLYFQRVQTVLGDTVDPYLLYKGKIVAANTWEGDEDYAYEKSEWYKLAMQTNDIVFTDLYSDAITHKPIITVAQKCKTENSVAAFDIFPDKILSEESLETLPDNSSFFLCDTNDNLIFRKSKYNNIHSQEKIQNYMYDVIGRIKAGELESYNSYVIDMDNEKRGVYYYVMSNGWIGILTTPFHSILSELWYFTLLYFAIILIYVAAIIFIGIRSCKLGVLAERSNETVKVLSNSYYALYRINFETETYEMIKGSDFIKNHIKPTGNYSDFLQTTSMVIDPNAKEDFTSSFSCESIRNLVAKNVKDFGGDFKRLFDGDYRWVNVRLLFDSILAPNEVILCFREIDQDKQREIQERNLLENALESSRKNEKSKQAFFSNMSHDMRTPLNAIIGFSSLALKHISNPDTIKDYLNKINYSARTLLNLVNDILEMSRIEQGNLTLTNEDIDLEQCIYDCCSAFNHNAENENKTFLVDIDIQDKRVYGDSFRITQILNNLLSNAFKYTSEGDTISVSVKQMESERYSKYRIVIKDTGIGMSKEFLPSLFEPYMRETRFDSKKVIGTGLGMSIVKSLVMHMSGEINVESELGEGTVFTLTIPFLTVKSNENNTKTEDNTPNEALSLEGKKVLLAEDNELNMEITCEMLKMAGMEVTQAWNGMEAYETFKNSAPFEFDLILMDMQMPVMDGCEAAKNIRCLQRPDAANIPIIAVTANAFAEDVAATSAAGMNGHISKPVDMKVLCQTMSRLAKEYNKE